MAINKVVDRNGATVIDLTTDTITPEKVLSGEKFHGADGEVYYGRLEYTPPKKIKTIKFVDKYANLLYEFTLEEVMALTEMPPYNGTIKEDYLKFEDWNWTLEDLQTLDWEHTYEYPVIGAIFRPKDADILKMITVKQENADISFYVSAYAYYYSNASGDTGSFTVDYRNKGVVVTIDWGDGTIDEKEYTSNDNYNSSLSVSHTYATPGEYLMKITYSQGYIQALIDKHANYENQYGTPGLIYLNPDSYSYTSSKISMKSFGTRHVEKVGDIDIFERFNTNVTSEEYEDVKIYTYNFSIIPSGKQITRHANISELMYNSTTKLQYFSIPRYASNYYMARCMKNTPGAGFIPDRQTGYTSFFNVEIFNNYDGDIFYNKYGALTQNTGIPEAMFYNDGRINKIREYYVKLKDETQYLSAAPIYIWNNMCNIDPTFVEKIVIDSPWSRFCSGAQAALQPFTKLSYVKLAPPRNNMISYALFDCAQSGGNYQKVKSDCTIDLTSWTSVPRYEGSLTKDPIFGVENLSGLLTTGHKIHVRESLLDEFKSTKPWNIITDLYVGIPDEEIVED